MYIKYLGLRSLFTESYYDYNYNNVQCHLKAKSFLILFDFLAKAICTVVNRK